MKKPRKGPGRPPADDKVEHVVFFRLDSKQLAEAEKRAKWAGFASVNAYAKALVVEKPSSRNGE